jgi:dolichol-phosphate hexosyltransferase
MKISIILPTLNEELGIPAIKNLIPFADLTAGGWDTEVIIVDGGSTDKTKAIALSLGFKVINARCGYGRQYQSGFSEASGDIIITADADATYPMEKIPAYLEVLIQENLDFITINRFANLEPGSMAVKNYWGNRILTFCTNLLFFLTLKDSQNGMWIFRKTALQRIKLKAQGMAFSEEIKIEAFLKTKAKEIPGAYKNRIGKTKLRTYRDGLGNLGFLFLKRLLVSFSGLTAGKTAG